MFFSFAKHFLKSKKRSNKNLKWVSFPLPTFNLYFQGVIGHYTRNLVMIFKFTIMVSPFYYLFLGTLYKLPPNNKLIFNFRPGTSDDSCTHISTKNIETTKTHIAMTWPCGSINNKQLLQWKLEGCSKFFNFLPELTFWKLVS